MKKEIIIALILLLLLLSKKSPKQTGTFIDPLVTSYKDPEGNVYFAAQINDMWYQVNATGGEKKNVGNYTLETKTAPNGGFVLTVSMGANVATYFADKEGITI